MTWQQDEPQPSVEQYAVNLDKLLERSSEFDHVCSGHGDSLLDKSIVSDLRENTRRILSGIEGEPMVLGEGVPEDFVMYKIEYMRVSRFGNSCIGYDVRYVSER